MSAEESDTRALTVLRRALRSTSRATRVRAVSMLSRFACAERTGWLETALSDEDPSVSGTALAVLAWVVCPGPESWPDREDPRFDRCGVVLTDVAQTSPTAADSRWRWEYVVEVWRDDGLLVGCYLAGTCSEDDEYAKRIALGQAIIANSGRQGDCFDAASAAAFVVGKRRLHGGRLRGGRDEL